MKGKSEKITELESQLMLMGLSGLAYTSEWNKKVEQLDQLRKGLKK